MHPYSKRPPEPLSLGTGDYEAVGYDEPSIPRAPRTPIFHRSTTPTPGSQRYGFGVPGTYPAHYSQAPAAPNSLSPMAMGASRDAVATGPQRAQATVVIRSRPTVRAGFTILVAGALIGGFIGVMTRARHNLADAALAVQTHEASPTQATSATPLAVNPGGPVVLPQAPTQPPPQAYANIPFGSLVPPQPPAPPASAAKEPKKPQTHATWVKPANGGGHPSIAAKVTPPKEKKEKDKDDGYKVASAGGDDPPSKPEKDPPKEKEPPKDKEPPKKTAEKPAKAAKGSSDDAVNVLKAAMGATENTL